MWNVILTLALRLICAAYVGLAEAAAEKARASASRKDDDGVTAFLIGEMMQPKKQHRFTGRLAMGLDPVTSQAP